MMTKIFVCSTYSNGGFENTNMLLPLSDREKLDLDGNSNLIIRSVIRGKLAYYLQTLQCIVGKSRGTNGHADLENGLNWPPEAVNSYIQVEEVLEI